MIILRRNAEDHFAYKLFPSLSVIISSSKCFQTMGLPKIKTLFKFSLITLWSGMLIKFEIPQIVEI